MKARIIFHGAAILVLLGTVAAAQTPRKPATTVPTGQSADCEFNPPSVSEVTMGNDQARGREASSAMATRRRPHQTVPLGSGRAPEPLIAFTQADKARGGQMQVVVYKDPEDMTAADERHNNRIAKTRPNIASSTTPPGQ